MRKLYSGIILKLSNVWDDGQFIGVCSGVLRKKYLIKPNMLIDSETSQFKEDQLFVKEGCRC